jgi:hypothetical protein
MTSDDNIVEFDPPYPDMVRGDILVSTSTGKSYVYLGDGKFRRLRPGLNDLDTFTYDPGL